MKRIQPFIFLARTFPTWFFIVFLVPAINLPYACASHADGSKIIQINFNKTPKITKTKRAVLNSKNSTQVITISSFHLKLKLKKLKTVKKVTGNKTALNKLKIPKISRISKKSKPKKDAALLDNNKVLKKSGLLSKNKDYGNNLSHIFPVIINSEIIHYIHYYQTAGRNMFARMLARSKRYIPMIKSVFKKLGIPNDLAYLAMVESGFSPTAYSYAGASGMWQFIPSTARLFGLTINWWVDERRNPVESTYAAGKYLKNLFQKFGSWYLAAAAYNSGELTIERALSLYPNSNFWTISQNKPYLLPGQTRRYVPKIIAAAIIAKDPQNFGFYHIKYAKPIRFVQVNIPFSVNLYYLAKCAGIPENRLWQMNPDLLRNATPPNDPGFLLNIPANRLKIFKRRFKNINKYMKTSAPEVLNASYSRPVKSWYYTVEPGNSLDGIASRFGIPVHLIESYNNINAYTILRVGEKLLIPGRNGQNTTTAYSSNNFQPLNLKVGYVIVTRGMTLWNISHRYNIPVDTIKALNHLSSNNIHVGEKLYLKAGLVSGLQNNNNNSQRQTLSQKMTEYRVRFGDTLYSIAAKFNSNVHNIMTENNIKNPNAIYPGETLRIN